ncbi:YncE family protein [Streptomyces sp. NPDC051243]|uniref:YncE family protein n=1 Tax=Streptomyces sp. NPDC051243 TaxID=3365646 RepID=UPI0037953502
MRCSALATAAWAKLRPTGNRVTGYIAVGAVGALIGTSLAVGAGASGTRPRLADIGAWLVSSEKGEVAHAHGLTGAVDGRVVLPAGMAGHPVSVARDGDTTLVLDERTGRVVRIDTAQLTAEQSADYGAAGLQLLSGGAYAYVVGPAQGTVQRIDPARTTPEGPPVELGGRPGAAVVDGDGTLWVPMPDEGTVVPFVEGRRGTAIEVADAGHDLTLTVAGGRPVVTDRTAAAMKTLTVTGVRGTFGLGDAIAGADPADVLVPATTDGSAVPVLAAGSGELVVVDVRSRGTTHARVPVAGQGPGAPQLLGKRVYLPDESTGRLLVYDTSLSAPAEPVPVTDGAGELELFVRDGLLWVNDQDGAAAAVIDADGEVRRIGKYGTDVPSARGPGDGPVEDSVPTGAPATWVQQQPTAPVGTAPGPGAPAPGPSGGVSGETPGPGPTQPEPEPGAPGAPQAESRSGAIRITFAKAQGATPRRYVLKGLMPDQTVTPAEVGPDGPFTFEVRGGSCEEQYSFTVVAKYGSGKPDKESARSALARPCVAPGAPRNVTFTPDRGGHGGKVSWQPPQGADDTLTYTINGPGGTAETTGLSHSYANLPNGRISSVAVMASNAAGAGAAASGWLDLRPPPQLMRIVNNANDGTSVGIRSEPHSTESVRVGRIPPGQSPEVTVHCRTKGQEITHDSTTTDVWARHTYYDPTLAKNITGYTSDHWVNSRSNPDVWECE